MKGMIIAIILCVLSATSRITELTIYRFRLLDQITFIVSTSLIHTGYGLTGGHVYTSPCQFLEGLMVDKE